MSGQSQRELPTFPFCSDRCRLIDLGAFRYVAWLFHRRRELIASATTGGLSGYEAMKESARQFCVRA
jgi:hypothetical protein